MLTPIDIENKEFARAFRGYEQTEVDEFMRTLLVDYEKLYRENGSLKDRNDLLTETLDNYKGMESTMKDAILMAQKTAEEIKQNAFRDQEAMLKETEMKAKNAIQTAEKRLHDIEKEYKTVQSEMNAFKARMSSLLSTYMQILQEVPKKTPEASQLPDDINEKKSAVFKQELQNSDVSVNSVDKNNDDKKAADAASQNEQKEYAPKKINPLVDELLKKRDSEKKAE